MKSKTVFEYLVHIPEIPEAEDVDFEEVPDDFDDGWTEEMILAVANRILADINMKEGTNYKLAEIIQGDGLLNDSCDE